MDRRLRELRPPPPEWHSSENSEQGDNLDAESFEELCDAYTRRRSQEQALTARVEGRLAGLRTQLRRIAAEDEDAFAEALRAELEAIAEKEKALTEGWKGFISSLGNAFDGLLQDLERLRARITDLNRLLARASVSDLKNLKLEVRDRPELVPQIRHVVEHQAKGGFDLFDDPEAFDRAARQLEAFLDENPELRLPDLFHVEFLVTRADGQTQRYPHLDKVESNGTSITIKVLTNLMLLRGLFRDAGEFQLPFFLDESNALDRDNLTAIVDLAREQSFVAILASPDVSDAADQLYFPELAENGRVVIREPHRVIVRGLDEGDGDAGESGPDRATEGA